VTKESEENRTRKAIEVVVVTQLVANWHVKAQFDATWIIITIKNVGGSFHKIPNGVVCTPTGISRCEPHIHNKGTMGY
jgi:hypothetical protein